MNYIFLTGLIGSLILVAGAAWPENMRAKKPIHSTKNKLFAIGNLMMIAFAIMGWLDGGSLSFVILEALIIVATALMIIDAPDRVDVPIISITTIALVVWSLYLFEDKSILYFVFGLAGLGLGYTFPIGTTRRNAALTIGSFLVAIFSYIEANWIFFWLNIFFAGFSFYYLMLPHAKKSRR